MIKVGIQLRAKAELELRRRQAQKKKLPFAQWLPEVSPTYNWTWAHLQRIMLHLDLVTSGAIKKLMITTAPRHGKSELVTVRYPVFRLEENPHVRVIEGAYNQLLANKFSRKSRRIAMDRIALSPERTAVEDWETIAGGGFRAVGVGSGVTGQGADLIIIDDPVKSREEANSEAYRERLWDWYSEDIYTRLEPNAAIILIETRWHEDDLAGRILDSEDGKNWTLLNLPALAEADDPLGRAEGEALCPERYTVEDLNDIKLVMGSAFQALYQQRPTAQGGEIFKREWWQYYKVLPKLKRIIQSWDTGFKKNSGNDPSCCLTWGEAENGYYLIDRWNEKVEFPELKRAAIQQRDKHSPILILIEDKASGQSLIQELQRGTTLPVIPYNPDGDKVARAHSVTPLCEAGKVFLPEDAPWVITYVDQMAKFPAAAHDEDVDVTSQALSYLSRGGGNLGMFDYIQQEVEKMKAARTAREAEHSNNGNRGNGSKAVAA